MATHSSILAQRISWTEEPGYSPWGHKQLDTTESTQHTHVSFTAPGTGLDRSLFFSVNRWPSVQLCRNSIPTFMLGTAPRFPWSLELLKPQVCQIVLSAAPIFMLMDGEYNFYGGHKVQNIKKVGLCSDGQMIKCIPGLYSNRPSVHRETQRELREVINIF